MPLENLEEEGLPKNPDLRIAQLKFLLTMDGHRQDAKVKTELMDAIKANSELAFHYVAFPKWPYKFYTYKYNSVVWHGAFNTLGHQLRHKCWRSAQSEPTQGELAC